MSSKMFTVEHCSVELPKYTIAKESHNVLNKSTALLWVIFIDLLDDMEICVCICVCARTSACMCVAEMHIVIWVITLKI